MSDYCAVCHGLISVERTEALRVLNVENWQWTCINCAPNDKIQGIYSGVSGCSLLILADKLDRNEGIYLEEQEDKQEFIQNIEGLD
ncbi:MAG: hypothetical protein AABY22_20855 [Nanoarchaeota archaeon]